MHPGVIPNMRQVPEIVNIAYQKAATASIAASGFRRTGIYPLDPSVFNDYDFAPADVADVILEASKDAFRTPCPSTTLRKPQTQTHAGQDGQIENDPTPTIQPIPGLSRAMDETCKDPSEPKDISLEKSLQTLFAISPLPKAAASTQKRQGGRKEKCAVLTSSPYKTELEDSVASSKVSPGMKRKPEAKCSSK